MEADKLLAFFRQGLIPGPDESEEAFLKRAEARPPLPSPEWRQIAPALFSTWGFSIDWVPIHFSSQHLLPWEGALFATTENGLPFIQLRSKNLWNNSREEILLHEAIHAARETFNEPKFEEFLAYAASSSRWKRWLGPLFERRWEFFLFASALFLFPWIPLICSVPLSFFLLRLCYKHLLFSRLKKKVPLPIILCMTDHEIQASALSPKFATFSLQSECCILPNPSLRLQLINALIKHQ